MYTILFAKHCVVCVLCVTPPNALVCFESTAILVYPVVGGSSQLHCDHPRHGIHWHHTLQIFILLSKLSAWHFLKRRRCENRKGLSFSASDTSAAVTWDPLRHAYSLFRTFLLQNTKKQKYLNRFNAQARRREKRQRWGRQRKCV